MLLFPGSSPQIQYRRIETLIFTDRYSHICCRNSCRKHRRTSTSRTLRRARTSRTYKRTRISKANKSNNSRASPTTGQDIFSSGFYEQSYIETWSSVFIQRRTRLPRQFIKGLLYTLQRILSTETQLIVEQLFTDLL